MSAHFEAVDRRAIPALNLSVERYHHPGTGARHLHLASDDGNNAFAVAFLTVPADSTGVAHILEHTVLCGSERFPVRDPFFNMLKRSLNTFMNAFTASDWTAYPFASQNRKDFDNLLQVYLDAVFFPRLDPLDFAQEGHRLEPAERGNPDAALEIKGVVYNEMKGAMSPPVSQVHQALQSALFPTITYHHNSGGDPACIPDLTYEELRAFHRRHYHPSNALFLTYGNFPVKEHHERIHELALARFEAMDVDLHVPDERRYTQPQRVEQFYATDNQDDLERQNHVLLGWLLGNAADTRAMLEAHLLQGVLMEHGGSPLRAALETTELGASPSELCGLDDSTREASFTVGLEGARAEDADAIEALVMGVLTEVADSGIAQPEVEAILHQIELAQREVGGDHFPYGLSLMLKAMGPALHGGDPVAALDIEAELGRLAEAAREPQFIPGLVRRLLLDNPHRVRLTMRPSTTLAEEREQALRARLRDLRSSMSAEARRHLADQAETLERMQDAEPDVSMLPRVGIEDVPADVRIPQGSTAALGTSPCTWYEAGTNGLVYTRLVVPLASLDADQLALLPLYCDLLTEVGCADRDYRSNQSLQTATVGALDAGTSLRARMHDANTAEGYFVLSGKALRRNQAALGTLLCETLGTPRFDEPARLRELVSQLRAHEEARVTDIGHSLAMTAAAAALRPGSALNERWSGLTGIAALKRLDDNLRAGNGIESLRATLEGITVSLTASARQFAVVAEADARGEIEAALAAASAGLPAAAQAAAAVLRVEPAAAVDVAWLVNSQVNFCARAYPAAAQGDDDAAALFVLASLMRNDFLHRELREKGGAYGGGASYDAANGTFGFFSYRDPRLSGTLADFQRAVDWSHDAATDSTAREQAILSVISAIDRPGSPAGEAITAFMGGLHGRTPEARRALRRRLLDVDAAALRSVADRYLQPERARTAVVTSRRNLQSDGAAPQLEVREL